MRGATRLYPSGLKPFCISIHAPRAGSDLIDEIKPFIDKIFQSTLPVRGATRLAFRRCRIWDYFNPRSPCGERLAFRAFKQCSFDISIHAPRAGSDPHFHPLVKGFCNFNPRSPCGERRCIRAARFERQLNFNPRSPCGERQRLADGTKHKDRISIHAPRAGSDSIAFDSG